jgi:hypothetical protein
MGLGYDNTDITHVQVFAKCVSQQQLLTTAIPPGRTASSSNGVQHMRNTRLLMELFSKAISCLFWPAKRRDPTSRLSCPEQKPFAQGTSLIDVLSVSTVGTNICGRLRSTAALRQTCTALRAQVGTVHELLLTRLCADLCTWAREPMARQRDKMLVECNAGG